MEWKTNNQVKEPIADYKFVADVHLGKLARLLRLLGIDTAYHNSGSNADLLQTAAAENRVLLSRNPTFSTKPVLSFHILTEDPAQQIKAVVSHFQLFSVLNPLSRCLKCNGLLHTVEKERVHQLVPQLTFEHYSQFRQCSNCQKVYWKGAHYARISQTVAEIERLQSAR